MVNAMPLHISCIVMETMNGESRKVEMKKPVTAPQTQPIARAVRNARMNGCPDTSIIMNTHDESAMTEPIDISSCPVRKTNVRPTAAIPYPGIESKRVKRLYVLRKRGRIMETRMNTTPASRGILYSLNSLFNKALPLNDLAFISPLLNVVKADGEQKNRPLEDVLNSGFNAEKIQDICDKPINQCSNEHLSHPAMSADKRIAAYY